MNEMNSLQLSQADFERLLHTILDELQKTFPEGTVKKQSIPAQAYIDRLNKVAGPYCSILDKSHSYIPEYNTVTFTVTIDILGVKRDGTGIQKVTNNSMRDAFAGAKTNAIRDACNMFQMGWRDLAKYRDWGNSLGITILQDENISPNKGTIIPRDKGSNKSIEKEKQQNAQQNCVKCLGVLLPEDHEERNKYGVAPLYCKKCLPEHFRVNATKKLSSK